MTLTPLSAISIKHANIIEQALQSDDGTVKYWTSQMTADVKQLMAASGLVITGVAPGRDDESFWTVLTVQDRSLADSIVKPFRVASAPISFRLTPVDPQPSSPWAPYQCPVCNECVVDWFDGDSVGVPVLPDGIANYNDIDTSLMVGTCRACDQPLFCYEFGFSNVTNPDADVVFCMANIEQEPDRYQVFKAEADGLEPWFVARRWYTTGTMPEGKPARLLKGPFTVDYHQFGPFKLAEEGELSGRYGVARCGGLGENSKWMRGEELFRNLANAAMQQLLAAE